MKRVNKPTRFMAILIVAMMAISTACMFAYAEAEAPVNASAEQAQRTGVFVPDPKPAKTVYIRVNNTVVDQSGSRVFNPEGYKFYIKPSNDRYQYPTFGSTKADDCTVAVDEGSYAKTPELAITDTWFDENVKNGDDMIVLTYDVTQECDKDEIIYDNQIAKAIITVTRDELGEIKVEQSYEFLTSHGEEVSSDEAACFTNVVAPDETKYSEARNEKNNVAKYSAADTEDVEDEDYSNGVKTGDKSILVLWIVAMGLSVLDFLLIRKSKLNS